MYNYNGDNVKKWILLLLSCLLVACSTEIKIEEEATLKVAVENEAYGEGLKVLWNETYPEHADALKVSVITEHEILESVLGFKGIPYDVFLIKDEDVATALTHLYEIPKSFYEQFEAGVREDFSATINVVKNCYYPIIANGFLYALNLTAIEEKGLKPEVFETMETLASQGVEKSFYYFDNPLFLLPLLSSDGNYFPGKEEAVVNFKSEAFMNSLNDYIQIKKTLQLESDPTQFDQWFISQSYLSGLIGPWMQYEKSEEINNLTLRFQKLPTIDGKQLKTLAVSYGYVINADTIYPNASLKLLKLMHSTKGMQLLLDTSNQVPLILDEEMEAYTYSKSHQKEKVSAMNGAMQQDLVGLKENANVLAMGIFDDESVRALINQDCMKDAEACVNLLSEKNIEWIKKQAEK